MSISPTIILKGMGSFWLICERNTYWVPNVSYCLKVEIFKKTGQRNITVRIWAPGKKLVIKPTLGVRRELGRVLPGGQQQGCWVPVQAAHVRESEDYTVQVTKINNRQIMLQWAVKARMRSNDLLFKYRASESKWSSEFWPINIKQFFSTYEGKKHKLESIFSNITN